MRFEAFLPWPPTVNRIWRRSGHRMHRSVDYEAWRQKAGEALRRVSLPEPFLFAVSVELRLYGPSLRSYDIDNRAKAVLDLLQSEGVLRDDNQVNRLLLRRGKVLRPSGLVHVILDRMDVGLVELPDAFTP